MLDNQTPFSVEKFFVGKTEAWGIFEDRFGQLRRSFRVDIEGKKLPNGIKLVENFVYNDGVEDKRVWHIQSQGEHSYVGHADDIIGTAHGEVSGCKLHWTYQMNLKVGKRTYRVNFDDNMYLQTDNKMINVARVKKYGLLLGTVTLFFSKPN